MKVKAKAESNKPLGGALLRTKIYSFELLMSIVGLLAIAYVVDYGLFSIFGKLTQASAPQYDSGDFITFLVAAMIVWLPVAVVFYLRVRGEISAERSRASETIYKILVSVFMFLNIIAAIGALFYVVYTLLQLAVGSADNSSANLFLRSITPGVLMALWHLWLFSAFSNNRAVSSKLFAIVVSVITVAVIVGLISLTASGIRAQVSDGNKEADLRELSQATAEYHRKQGELPDALSALELTKLNNELGEYSFKVISDKRYQLCANFEVDTSREYDEWNDEAYYSSDTYRNYPVWNEHDAGEFCYHIDVDYSSSILR